ncbi:MAG: glycoside hydrolase family 16 protein, partial [Candidatus Eremiobacteraeota bacterium]|nr:glycoside hydrolase family 16 protein [Candidatus Eremiobacteraeota bacterium]
DTLVLSARKAQSGDAPHRYISGLITTGRDSGPATFSQRYGYVEAVAKFPRGRGLWPAFWLRDSRGKDAEIDVFEFLGDDVTSVYQSVHYASGGGSSFRYRAPFDPTKGFHTYGVRIGPDRDTFYVDGLPTHSVRDASVNALYIIVSMQVGAPGSWPGPPDEATHWPASLEIRAIRAYTPANGPCEASQP